MVPEREAPLDPALVEVAARLVVRFQGELDPTLVENAVRRCAAEFADVRIAAFVPLLVERRSREELRAHRRVPDQA